MAFGGGFLFLLFYKDLALLELLNLILKKTLPFLRMSFIVTLLLALA